MSSFSPTAEGFRLIFRQPTIPLAEIAWRWSIGVAVWFVAGMFLAEYADSLPVRAVDRLLLGTRQPGLQARALARILHGSGLRFTEGGILAALGLTVAWIVLAALGRAATLKAIMQEFSLTAAEDFSLRSATSLAALNFLRAALMLAAIVATIGSALIVNGVWASSHMTGSDAARIWLAQVVAVWIAWAVLNWTTSTASMFVLVNGANALTAVSQTVDWYRDRIGRVTSAGIWFGLARVGALATAWIAAFTVLSMAGALGSSAILFLEILILGAYCACADFLYTGRQAAYVRIIRGEEFVSTSVGPERPVSGPGPESFSIDQSELILSDVPLPAS